MDRAVKLENTLAAGFLVQPVDVLRHNAVQLPGLLQLRQLVVCGIGLGLEGKHLVPVEAVEIIGVAHEIRVAEHGLRRNVVFLVVEPVRRAEVGYAALGGNACSPEKHDALRDVDDLLK